MTSCSSRGSRSGTCRPRDRLPCHTDEVGCRRRLATVGWFIAAAVLIATACGSSSTVATEPTSLGSTTSATIAGSTSGPSGSAGEDEPPTDDRGSGDLGPLVRCEDVPELSATAEGSLDQFANPDDEVMGVLVTYGLEHPDTYAGLWIDRDKGGALVVAFTDDPGPHLEAILARGPTATDVEMVSPRPPIEDSRSLGERDDVTIDVVRAAFSEAELMAANESFWDDRPPYVLSGGIATTRNRISLDLIDPTSGQLADLVERIPLDMTCVNVTVSPTPPGGTLDVLPDDETFLTCGESGVPGFLPSAIEERVPVENVADPAAHALISVMADPPPHSASEDIEQRPPEDGWFVLAIHDSSAIFGHGAGSPMTAAFLTRKDAEDGWRFDGWTISCRPTVSLPPGLGHVRLELDPSRPRPAPDDTVIHLQVTERACVSGQAMGERLRGPQLRETEDEIMIAFAVALLVEPSTCPGNPSEAVTIELAGPVGSRPIRNGLIFPPTEIDFPIAD